MKKTYLFSYFGNKDKEVEEIYKFIEPKIKEFKTIIEPFGGSFAFIRYLINEKNFNHYEYIVNDNDKLLIKTYNTYKDEIKNNENIEIYKKIFEECKGDKNKYKKEIKKDDVNSYLLYHTYYNINKGMFPEKKKNTINLKNIIERVKKFTMYKDVNFIDIDGFDLIEKYKDNEKAFLFLDPPFLLSCNSHYMNTSIEKIIKVIQNFYKYKCTILLTLGNHILYSYMLDSLKIEIKFKTKLKFRGYKQTENIYICNKDF